MKAGGPGGPGGRKVRISAWHGPMPLVGLSCLSARTKTVRDHPDEDVLCVSWRGLNKEILSSGSCEAWSDDMRSSAL